MRKIFIIGALLVVSVGAKGQLTLDECRRMAREHYPEIACYDLIRQSTEYTLSNARRAYLPQVALSGQASWQTDVPEFPKALSGMLAGQGLTIPGMNQDQYKVSLEVNQTLWDGGKSRADRQIAQAESLEAQRSVDVDLYALEGRVDDLFFGILLLEEQIGQTKLTMNLLRSNLEKIHSMQRNGVAMQSDADAVEAELLSVGQQLGQVEASRDSYRRMLAIFIGKDAEGVDLERPVADEPRGGDPQRPELEWFDAQIGKLSARESLIKSSTRPRFGLFAQGYYGYPGLDYFESMMSNDWSWNAVVGVRMSWNFGAYYTRKNSLNQLRTAQRQVDVQRDVFLFNTRLQATQESGEVVRLRKALADDDRIVELRRSVREAAESKLRNGVIDTDDLLRKITEESAAMMARSAREIELLKAIYEWKHTINR